MKFITYNFNHPVKGHAVLTQLLMEKPQTIRLDIDSQATNLVEIPVDKCGQGKWKAVLNWEYENELFVHQDEFEI